MEKMIHIKINGRDVEAPEGSTILEAARGAGIDIPTLCYLRGVNNPGSCRMCVVEVKGNKSLQAACVYPISEGMEIDTRSKRVRDERKLNMELILSNHQRNCLECPKNNHCELRNLAGRLGVDKIRFENTDPLEPVEDTNTSIIRNNNKCILCRRCVSVCREVQKVKAIDVTQRGFKTRIAHSFDRPTEDSECILCGQCILVCPTGALTTKDNTQQVWDAIDDPNKHVVAQVAPAVRAALGEEFGLPMGTNVTGKMVSAIRELGFDRVFDTNTGADITIMEEGTELLDRVQNGGTLPMITSCSPGWVKYCEHFYPELIPNLSSCKSPHTMFGAMIKSYYAEKENIDPKDIYVVSIMPCTAKKFEITRDNMGNDGVKDVDTVITTRELAKMIKEASIDFTELDDTAYDAPFETEASGAGAIFGVSGGVMEAAVRTVAEKLLGRELEDVDYYEARGKEGVKEITVNAGETTLKGVVVSGVGNAKEILDDIKAGKSQYQFIEVMGCPGGCIMGGGQPLYDTYTRENVDVFGKRSSVLYGIDKQSKVRKSHENPDIIKLYDEFLGEPNSEIAHKYLHTSYVPRGRYGKTD